jgi:hypothetical protein
MFIRYFKFQSDASLDAKEAKVVHYNNQAYVASIYSEHLFICQMTVYANRSLIVRYFDSHKRWRWSCHWNDKSECGNNQLSNVHCFVYNDDNGSNEENFKSNFTHYNQNDKRKDYVGYFHLGTSNWKFRDFEQRRIYSLQFPEFGKYEEYLNFPYQDKFPELEEWPESIFPTGEKPHNNIPIPHIQL